MSTARPLRPGGLLFAPLLFAACAAPGTPRYGSSDAASPTTADAGHDATVALDGALAGGSPDLARGCGDSGCSPDTPACDPATGRCVACLPARDTCERGSFCIADGGFACAPGCKAASDCAPLGSDGGTGPDGGAPGPLADCCGHQCVDVASDPSHCGACGNACVNQDCCGGRCADTTRDPANCGACGRTCGAPAHAMVACANSACKVTACVAPYLDCNLDPSDGCEANPASDPLNCGACGTFCGVANGVGTCTRGVCGFGSCYKGFGDCDGNPQNGCEAVITTDPKNCGACGRICSAPPHASATCMGGACVVAGCDPGFADCDMNAQNGCEVTLATDKNNCGMCGTSCALLPNAVAGCANGACAIAACSAPFGDCNKKVADGCEADLTGDVANCGKCGMACPNVPNGTASCTQSACGIKSCTAGYADCDKNAANGCEVNLSTDSRNCGKCGTACPNAQTCVNGVCVACGNDCWGASGCVTAAGHCIQFTCRPGSANGTFCNGCLGWKEVTYQQWMGAGYCQDVIARYRVSDGTATHCGGAPSCCHGAANCGAGDNAWHFWDGAANRYTGPCIGCANDANCTYWNGSDASNYTRITVCEHP